MSDQMAEALRDIVRATRDIPQHLTKAEMAQSLHDIAYEALAAHESGEYTEVPTEVWEGMKQTFLDSRVLAKLLEVSGQTLVLTERLEKILKLLKPCPLENISGDWCEEVCKEPVPAGCLGEIRAYLTGRDREIDPHAEAEAEHRADELACRYKLAAFERRK